MFAVWAADCPESISAQYDPHYDPKLIGFWFHISCPIRYVLSLFLVPNAVYASLHGFDNAKIASFLLSKASVLYSKNMFSLGSHEEDISI